jgi:hypothetical protein
MDLVRKWLGYEPPLNQENAKYDDQNIKPQQTSQLKNMMETMHEGVAALKVDGHGYIVTYTKPKGTEACTRNAKKRNKYVESYIIDPDKLDPDVESFALAGELAAYVDEAGNFENPADMLEMGYSLVFPVTDYCPKHPHARFVCLKVLAFRLFHINGLRGSMMKTSDQLRILEDLLKGQPHIHVVRWYKFAVSPPNRVLMEITRGGEMQDVCSRDDFTDYLITRAGTREGFVVSDDRVDKPAQFKLDHKRQLRDPYCAKARKDFVANLVGALRCPNFDMFCVDELGDRMKVASIKSQEVSSAIRNALAEMTPPEEVRITVRAPNLVVNSKGEFRFMGMHTYMPFSKEGEYVSGIHQIMAQRPHFQASLEKSNEFWRLTRDYVPGSTSIGPAVTHQVGVPAAFPAAGVPHVLKLEAPKPPADPLKGEGVYIWRDKFTDQEVKKMYDRCKRLGASCWGTRNRIPITAILVHPKSGYWCDDGEFANWYTSIKSRARIYKVESVDPCSHRDANSRCNYLEEAWRYIPNWRPTKKTKVEPTSVLPPPVSVPEPAHAEPQPEPVQIRDRTKIWPAEYVHLWHTGHPPEDFYRYDCILTVHAFAVSDLSYVNRKPKMCDILFVKDASTFGDPATAQDILRLCESFDTMPLVLPTKYIDDRLAAFPAFVSTRDYAIIPQNFPDDYKTYWRDFHAK